MSAFNNFSLSDLPTEIIWKILQHGVPDSAVSHLSLASSRMRSMVIHDLQERKKLHEVITKGFLYNIEHKGLYNFAETCNLFLVIGNDFIVEKVNNICRSSPIKFSIDFSACSFLTLKKEGNLQSFTAVVHDPRYDADVEDLFLAAEKGYIHIVEKLLKDGIDPCHPRIIDAITKASENGHDKVAKMLNIREANGRFNKEIIAAAANGIIDDVENLLQCRFNGKFYISAQAETIDPESLEFLSSLGDEENEAFDRTKAIEAASANGHRNIVKLLQEWNENTAFNDWIIDLSEQGEIDDIGMYLLLSDPVDPVAFEIPEFSQLKHTLVMYSNMRGNKSERFDATDAIRAATANGHKNLAYMLQTWNDKTMVPRMVMDYAAKGDHINLQFILLLRGNCLEGLDLTAVKEVASANGHDHIVQLLQNLTK